MARWQITIEHEEFYGAYSNPNEIDMQSDAFIAKIKKHLFYFEGAVSICIYEYETKKVGLKITSFSTELEKALIANLKEKEINIPYKNAIADFAWRTSENGWAAGLICNHFGEVTTIIHQQIHEILSSLSFILSFSHSMKEHISKLLNINLDICPLQSTADSLSAQCISHIVKPDNFTLFADKLSILPQDAIDTINNKVTLELNKIRLK